MDGEGREMSHIDMVVSKLAVAIVRGDTGDQSKEVIGAGCPPPPLFPLFPE